MDEVLGRTFIAATNPQSMKVVASTKLTKAERAMREAKKYGAANNGMSNSSNSTILPVSRLTGSTLPTDSVCRDRG
jgi:hypothetical protein